MRPRQGVDADAVAAEAGAVLVGALVGALLVGALLVGGADEDDDVVGAEVGVVGADVLEDDVGLPDGEGPVLCTAGDGW
jgi:hypothetical protein